MIKHFVFGQTWSFVQIAPVRLTEFAAFLFLDFGK